MNPDRFLSNVIEHLPILRTHESIEEIKGIIAALWRDGFSVEDAASFLFCMEEVNPLINEEFALRRMNALRIKYLR
jgi:hypothetical protein